MPSFCPDAPSDTGCNEEQGEHPGLPPVDIPSAGEQAQRYGKVSHDQAKPFAKRYRLNSAWINSLRLHINLSTHDPVDDVAVSLPAS
jgi:hypothetical protein